MKGEMSQCPYCPEHFHNDMLRNFHIVKEHPKKSIPSKTVRLVKKHSKKKEFRPERITPQQRGVELPNNWHSYLGKVEHLEQLKRSQKERRDYAEKMSKARLESARLTRNFEDSEAQRDRVGQEIVRAIAERVDERHQRKVKIGTVLCMVLLVGMVAGELAVYGYNHPFQWPSWPTLPSGWSSPQKILERLNGTTVVVGCNNYYGSSSGVYCPYWTSSSTSVLVTFTINNPTSNATYILSYTDTVNGVSGNQSRPLDISIPAGQSYSFSFYETITPAQATAITSAIGCATALAPCYNSQNWGKAWQVSYVLTDEGEVFQI